MFRRDQYNQPSGVSNFISGYVSYNGIGGGLAAALYNLAEWMLQLRR